VIKYSLLFLFVISVLLLGLTSPVSFLSGPGRDPVPNVQKVAHSSHCRGCHGPDTTRQALVDGNGKDVNIFDDWQISMMGLSAHDPFWRATLSHEVNAYPGAKEEIEKTCLKCHAPLGNIQAHLTGLPYSFEMMLADSLGLDGVSCSSCHQQPAKDLGKAFSGNFIIDTNRLLFGHYPNPVKGPMQIYVGFDPVFSDHIYSSGVCAGCHTLITETLDVQGLPTGNFFTEQATYHEWLNSIYPQQGKECQTCHLPFIQDSVIIATDLLALKKRFPYGLHQFFGANTSMLSLMHENQVELNLPRKSDAAWEESIDNNRISLRNAADLEINLLEVMNDTLSIDLRIKNKTGHKLPSGYPSRVVWIRVILSDAITSDTIYSNGLMDAAGNIEGRDYPFEPHHEISRSEEDVQIYEMVMSDIQGQLTTRLNAAYEPIKDNRLLPLGFRRDHFSYDTVAVWGNAQDDPQYNNESQAGSDVVRYNIPLNGRKGIADLDISLQYHTFPARWMEDLFNNDTVDFVAEFETMYQGYEKISETIDELLMEDILLSPSAVRVNDQLKTLKLFPQPGNGSYVMFEIPFEYSGNISFELVDINGRIIQTGKLQEKISFTHSMKPGLYYFIFYRKGEMLFVKPYSIL
jgi:hypothetical protein